MDGNPYVVEKRIGPVNYSIRNSKGISKVYHRNLITPALTRAEPSKTWSNIDKSKVAVDSHQASSKIIIPFSNPLGSDKPHTLESQPPSIDNEQFTRNVFIRPDQNHNIAPIVQTRSGRISKPVNRLIDEI